MRKLICLIVIAFLGANLTFGQDLTNQTDENGNKQGAWTKLYANGKKQYEGSFIDNKPTGKWKHYHPNGVIMAEIEYTNEGANTKLYDNQGKLMGSGLYIDGIKWGEWKLFKDNVLVAIENYKNNLKNGKSIQLYDTGEVFLEINYIDDVENGVYRSFNKNGSVSFECLMKDGERNGYCQSFFSNGNTEFRGLYKNGIREGKWEYFKEEDNSLDYFYIYNGGLIKNTEVRDSVETARVKYLEKDAKMLADPEKFMQDPSGYMEYLRQQRNR